MAEAKTLSLIRNVALTIPARIIIGMLTDKFGPRLTYSFLLFGWQYSLFGLRLRPILPSWRWPGYCSVCFVGAGFAIGIRMVSEWFPANELGTAEGIYGGWGISVRQRLRFCCQRSLCSLVATMAGVMPSVFWLDCLAFSFVCIPMSQTRRKVPPISNLKMGGLEVTSKGDFFFLLMKLPMYIALVLVTWKLSPHGVALISASAASGVYAYSRRFWFMTVSLCIKLIKKSFIHASARNSALPI